MIVARTIHEYLLRHPIRGWVSFRFLGIEGIEFGERLGDSS